MDPIILVLCGLVVLFAGIILLMTRDEKKLRRRLRKEFGKPPAQRRGLAEAAKYYEALRVVRPDEDEVDALTWIDLDMDDVYGRLNGCQSVLGDVRLYQVLRRPAKNPAQDATLAAREEMMNTFAKNVPLREKAQYRIARMGRADGAGLENMVFTPSFMALPGQGMHYVLAVLPFAAIPMFFANTTAAILWLIGTLLTNIMMSSIVKNRNELYFRAVRYLSTALSCAFRLQDILAKPLPDAAARVKENSRRFWFLRPWILILALDEMMEKSLGMSPLSLFQLPLVCYGRIAAYMAKNSESVEGLFNALGEVDLALGLLSYRISLPLWAAPQYTQEAELDFARMWHPLLDDPVPNDGHFEGDVLLTGSNASGKSTFIKAVALNILMAQTINTCTASSIRLKSGMVATSMAVADSVVDGDSYFVAEIKSMRRLVQLAAREDEAGEARFAWFFIDEILKGTNTVERIAASAAVLEALHDGECMCFAATHDIELTRILEKRFYNFHFRETVGETGVFFDYQLRQGPSTTRNALLLLERMGFPREVTDTARAQVAAFEGEGEWPQL